MTAYRGLSLWHDQVYAAGDPLVPRPGLPGDLDVDVCVVGAGFTGLWTAYTLLRADPSLRVVVLEAEIAGFGASGRNGGWCSALFPASASALTRRHGRDAALAMRRAMNDAVSSVVASAAHEKIDADVAAGGTVVVARSAVQLERARAEVAEDASFDGVDGLSLLDAASARAMVGASDVLGGVFTPHCARIQPAKLVRGLAEAVERLGGTIHERSPVSELRPGGGGARPSAVTVHGTVRADVVVRATEAWTSQLASSARAVIPVYSLMIATEPLPASFWASAGLTAGETFSDGRHLIIYGQRTADDRLAFGGRGAPYHAGSRIDPAFDRDEQVFAGLAATLRDLFPALSAHRFTHSWGGPLAIPRDWHASVGLSRSTGIAWAGGYVGDGVGTANLAGRTLSDLIRGVPSDLTTLPWVNHSSPRWEPEPLRWLGVNAGLRVMTAADAEEHLTHRPSLAARAFAPLLGH